MIHFVGAGPGDPELITVRGASLLARADLVIYAGSLVNPELLSLCGRESEKRNSAEMTLEEVIRAFEEADREKKEVVRLHTGDPSLYGAIREQMDALEERGIPYDVTPGVSSFSGAAAALHAEYTLPGISQSVILTRLAGRTPVPERESLRRLSEHGATIVIFLSAGHVEEVQQALLQGAYTRETPAAIVYKATWEDERVVRCTVGTLAEAAKQSGIEKTALIMVGDFLGDTYERSRLYDPFFTTGFREGKDGA